MAIQPKNEYSAQTTSPGVTYPYGRARNDSDVSAHDGTPLEEKWVNDLWGFLQALLVEGGVTPSGNPDTATASQYLNALAIIAAGIAHNEFDAAVAAIQEDVTALETVEAARIPQYYTVPLVMLVNESDRFAYGRFDDAGAPDGASTYIYQSDVTQQGRITIPLPPLWSGARIKENGLTVWVKGVAGHAGLPTLKPQVEIAIRSGYGTHSTLGVATDPSTTVGEYETEHPINVEMATHAFNYANQYHVLIRGEGSTNAIAGLGLLAVILELEAVP